MKEKVIILGYPKSGTTWLTRLAAELIACPVEGFLYGDHQEIAQEGEDRKSKFICFKGHQTWHQLKEEDQKAKIIYIIRDPRDVAISMSHYFYKQQWLPFGLENKSKWLRGLSNRISKPLGGLRKNRNEAVHTMIKGSTDFAHWVGTPWTEHWRSFLHQDVCFVSYESLLNSPIQECERILDHLQLSRTKDQVEDAIQAQSFGTVKHKFEPKKNAILRSGKSEQWRKVISSSELSIFDPLLKEYQNQELQAKLKA